MDKPQKSKFSFSELKRLLRKEWGKAVSAAVSEESPHAARNLVFKMASEDWEMDQIHRLNYKTFAEEIPQHERNPEEVLVDKFEEKSVYVVCVDGDRVVGMVCMCSERPFSIDTKLKDLDAYLPPGRNPCEARLLSVEKEYRSSYVFFGLMKVLSDYVKSRGYDLAVISGTVRQLRLYKHLGFVPFGPLLGTAEASFQGMYLTLEAFERVSKRYVRSKKARTGLVNLLPGPVDISPDVMRVFADVPLSHRSGQFVGDFQEVRKMLCAFTKAERVELMMGSGSLANDAVAAQLSLLHEPGIIASNGEFGERLVDQGRRSRLRFEVLRKEWGEPILREDIVAALIRCPSARWIWAVHHETSTGVLLDLLMLKTLARSQGLRICLDSVSSIGLVPVDLSGIYLASGVSGKGIGSYPGIAMVYYDHPIEPVPDGLPRYLDLGLYAHCGGIPFTISSNLIYALKAALEHFNSETRFKRLFELAAWLKSEIRGMGFGIMAPDEHACPPVLTIVPPEGVSGERMGGRLESAGYLLSYRSEYLRKRNLIQMCLMGECCRETIEPMLAIIKGFSPNAGAIPKPMSLSSLVPKRVPTSSR